MFSCAPADECVAAHADAQLKRTRDALLIANDRASLVLAVSELVDVHISTDGKAIADRVHGRALVSRGSVVSPARFGDRREPA